MSENNVQIKNVAAESEINNNNNNNNSNNNKTDNHITIDNDLLKNDLIHSAHLEAEDDQSLSNDFESDPIDEKPSDMINKQENSMNNNQLTKDYDGTLDPSV